MNKKEFNKYKLINIETREEHLCDKVTIDGFDYYESTLARINGAYSISSDLKIVQVNHSLVQYWKAKEGGRLIATNNPNIDIPKVVNEVFKLSFDYFVSRDKIDEQSMYDFKEGYTKHQKTHPFSDQDLKEALEDFHKMNMAYLTGKEDDNLDIEQFIKVWKEQRPKTIYYEKI